jgi:anti-sigma factor RsiW
MTCKEFVELVTAYLEGNLSPAEQDRFEAHLHGCKGCTSYMIQIEQTIRLTGTLSEDSITPPARDKFLHIFRDWKDHQTPD